MPRHAAPSTSSGNTKKRAVVLGVVTAFIAAMLPTIFVSPAQAADPDNVGSTLEGCKFEAGQVLPQTSGPYAGKFICDDDQYTPGNLAKGWNELDLVPHRVTLEAKNSAPATQTYTIAVVLDAEDAGAPGYDVISAPVLNTSLSDASCTAASVGAETIASPGLGGIDESRYRLMTVTQAKNTTCVYDYYGRLALGSHLFPGSSLHANLALPTATGGITTSGIGASDVSIPVNEILPQKLSKDMTASQGSNHTWNLTKESRPLDLDLGNTCDVSGDYATGEIEVEVTWTKNDAVAGGPVTITTNIYAENPASRTITINATDRIYSGNTQTTLLDTFNTGDVDVPPNSKTLIGTHVFVWNNPSGTTVNDVATATYTDKVTGVAVPGNTTASASATIQNNGPVTNQTATITDQEIISGNGLQFAVAAPSVGAFTGGYTAGTFTTGPVGWELKDTSTSGSVTFTKTIRAAKGTVEPNGLLADRAQLTGSNGFSARANAQTSITVDTRAELTIDKSIPNILQGSETQTFTFKVKNSGGTTVATPSITFEAGDTNKTTTVSDLPPDTYTVTEDPATGWKAQPPTTVNLTGARCQGTADFDNQISLANARVKKVTSPAGFEADWEFTLYEVGNATPIETVKTTGDGFIPFSAELEEGSYTIVETEQTGWVNQGGTGCEFDVDFPADAGKTFSCTYTNTYRPSVTLEKDGADRSKIGDKVDYTFKVTNTSPTGGTAGEPDLICTVKDAQTGFEGTVTLTAGESKTFTQTGYTIPNANLPGYNDGAGGTAYKNTATVDCTYDTGGVVATATSSHITNLFEPAVKLTKTGPTYAKVGDTVTYTVTIENKSSADSPNLELDSFTDDKVPGATPAATCDVLTYGETCTFDYTYTVQAGDYTAAGSTVKNTAEVHYNPAGFPNDITSKDDHTVTIIKPSFTITKDCLTPNVPVGSSATFGVDVTNDGDVPLNITVADSFPLTAANTELAVGSESVTLTFANGKVSFTVPVGKTVSLEIDVVVTADLIQDGKIKNNVTATATLDSRYGMPNYSVTKTATAECDVVSGATRTIGFWRTHLAYATHILDKHTLDAAAVRNADGTVLSVGSSRVDLQACKLEYSIVSPK